MKILAFIFSVLIINFPAIAQEPRIESQAIRCAGLASVHTSLILTNPSFAKAMATIGQAYAEIYASQRSRRTSVAVTASDVSKRREDVFVQLRKAWLENPEAVISEAALCNDWRAEIADSFISRSIPEPPVKASQSEIEKWNNISSRAFSAWFELSSCETCFLLTQLKQMLKQTGNVQHR